MKKAIINSLAGAAAIVLLLALFSCQREEILLPTSDYYLAIDVEPDALQKDFSWPAIYAVNFYDAADGRLVYSTYVRPEGHPLGLPYGGYVSNLKPGSYDVLVYNIDTRTTTVRETELYERTYAEADMFGRSNGVPVTHVPDHLYVWRGRVDVPYITEKDGVFVIDAHLRSIVEPWTVVVEGVTNLDLMQTATFYLSGQAVGRYLGSGGPVRQRSILSFVGAVADAGAEDPGSGPEGRFLTADYTTFGYLDGVGRVLLTLQMTGPNGSVYNGQADVTDQVLDPENNYHVIRVAFDIEIREREDGGFAPEARPWDPDVTVIVLE